MAAEQVAGRKRSFSLPAIAALVAAAIAAGTGVITVGRLGWIISAGNAPLGTLVDRLVHDDRLLRALGTTFRLAVLALGLQAGVSLVLVRFARAMHDGVKLLLLVPTLISASTAALAWFLWFSPSVGPANRWLTAAGLEAPLWFVRTIPMTLLAVAVDCWQWLPFFVVVLVHQAEAIPERLIWQARLEGASEWQIWRQVTIPFLLPTLLVLVAIRLLDLIRLYDIVYVLFGTGGPGNAMETLSIYTLKLTFQPSNEAYGAVVALTYLTLALVLLMGLSFMPSVRRLLPWKRAERVP